MISEKKELLIPEEILEIKNWNEKDQNFNEKDLSPIVDSAINKSLFKEDQEVYIKLKTKKPTRYFSKAYIIVDIGCDVIDEKFEIIVYYGDFLVYKNIFSIQKVIITRYKSEFEIKHRDFKPENFTIILRLLPSKKENIENYAFTVFSVFVETIIEEQKEAKIENKESFLIKDNSIEIINKKGKKLFIKNFWCENKKNLIKLSNKSRFVVHTIEKNINKILNQNFQKILIQAKFTLIQTKITTEIVSNFNVDLGVMNERLFGDFNTYEDIRNNVIKTKSFCLDNYTENYTVELEINLKSIENIIREDNLVLFFVLRDLENLEDFYITDIDFLIFLKK